jgi:hypothetical protein
MIAGKDELSVRRKSKKKTPVQKMIASVRKKIRIQVLMWRLRICPHHFPSQAHPDHCE